MAVLETVSCEFDGKIWLTSKRVGVGGSLVLHGLAAKVWMLQMDKPAQVVLPAKHLLLHH